MKLLLLTAKLLFAALLASTAAAQQVELPPIVRIVVPFPPGGVNDVMARAIASQLGPRLQRTVIVENRPGASGFIGAAAVAQAPRDGSTLLGTSASLVTVAATRRVVPIDVLNDLLPVAIMSDGPLVVAVPSKSEIRTPEQLIAAARAKPDMITYGTPGVGTIAHLATELLNEAARIELKHVPYKGGGPAMIDLISGNIDLMIAVNATFGGQVSAGRIRQIAVTSLRPSPDFPHLPPMSSVVPGYEASLWSAMFVPAGTPAAIVQRLNREINEVVKTKELIELMRADGASPVTLTPAEAATRVRESYATWKKLATTKNIVLD